MPSFNLSANSRNPWIIGVISFFWIAAKLIGWKLWLADRVFPIVPAFDFLVAPFFIHLLLFIFSLVVLLVLFIFPTNRAIQITVLVIEIISCLLDQNRWQPWEFQYFFIIFVFVINWKKEKNIPSVIGFILAAMYFYSGLSKMNPVFMHEVWYKIILTDILHFNPTLSHQPLIYHAGYLLGLIEISFSIGLFFQRTRKITGILILIMHFIILVIFGPWGLNYDLIIWPWNVALMLFVFILVFKTPNFTISFQSLLSGPNKLIILLFGILPLLNLFGYWEYFFSASLFSGRPPDMYISIKKSTCPKPLQAYCLENTTSSTYDSINCMIYVRDWAFREMIAPENPEIRIYKNIKEQLEKRYPNMDATFITYTYIKGRRVKAVLK